MITSHAFRPYGGMTLTGHKGGIALANGTCAWNGTCGQPADQHSRAIGHRRGRRLDPAVARAIVADHDNGVSTADLAGRHGASKSTVHRIVALPSVHTRERGTR